MLEGIAALAGYDEAGGYMAVDHTDAMEVMGGKLKSALRAGWLPKITNGWFFRAESFFSVARPRSRRFRRVPGDDFAAAVADFMASSGEGR